MCRAVRLEPRVSNWVYAHRFVLYAVGCVLVVLTSPQGDNQFGSIMAILVITLAAFVMMLLPADKDDDEAR